MGYTVTRSARKPSIENLNDSELSANAALKELFDLLEDYAPAWYTDQHHNRAVAALSRSSEHHLRPVEALKKTIALRSHYASDERRT
jgi:hypothetical protein